MNKRVEALLSSHPKAVVTLRIHAFSCLLLQIWELKRDPGGPSSRCEAKKLKKGRKGGEGGGKEGGQEGRKERRKDRQTNP